MITRRSFLAATAATPFILDSHLRAQERQGQGPNNRINLGFIGIGMQGRGHLGSFLGNPAVQVVAVCDVHRIRRGGCRCCVHRAYAQERKAGTYRGCTAYIDFRELLGRRDIDAVLIATPDHWHHIPAVLARERKDIYCEKPLSLTIAEARAMVRAARDNNIVFQTGSQQRTEFNGYFRKAVEYVRSGRIGQVRTVRVGVGGPARPCDLANEMTCRRGTDWEMWNGPSPARAFNQVLCPLNIHGHFPQWARSTANTPADSWPTWGPIISTSPSGPSTWTPAGRPKSIRPSAATPACSASSLSANGIEMFHGGPSDCTFEGSEGTISVQRRRAFLRPPRRFWETLLAERDFPSARRGQQPSPELDRLHPLAPPARRRGGNRRQKRTDLSARQHRLSIAHEAALGPGPRRVPRQHGRQSLAAERTAGRGIASDGD